MNWRRFGLVGLVLVAAVALLRQRSTDSDPVDD